MATRQFISTAHLSLLSTPLTSRWTIPLSSFVQSYCKGCPSGYVALDDLRAPRCLRGSPRSRKVPSCTAGIRTPFASSIIWSPICYLESPMLLSLCKEISCKNKLSTDTTAVYHRILVRYIKPSLASLKGQSNDILLDFFRNGHLLSPLLGNRRLF